MRLGGKRTILIASAGALLMGGCSSIAPMHAKVALIAVDYGKARPPLIAGGVVGTYCEAESERRKPTPTVVEALHDALAKAPGANALADVDIENTLIIHFLWFEHCVRVQGDAVHLDLGERRGEP